MKIKVNFCKTVHGLIKVMIWTALYEVSGNRYILQFGSEKINANAIKSDGRTLIKLIQE